MLLSPIQNTSHFKNIQKPHFIHRIFKLFRHENFLHRVRKGVNEQPALQKNFQFKDQIRSQTSDPSHISLRKSTSLLSHVSHKFVQECSQHVYLKIVADFCASCFPTMLSILFSDWRCSNHVSMGQAPKELWECLESWHIFVQTKVVKIESVQYWYQWISANQWTFPQTFLWVGRVVSAWKKWKKTKETPWKTTSVQLAGAGCSCDQTAWPCNAAVKGSPRHRFALWKIEIPAPKRKITQQKMMLQGNK